MKKLIMVMAIGLAGLVANAASVKWSAGNIYASNGTDKYSGAVKLYAVATGGAFSDAFEVASGTVSSGAIAATTSSSSSLVAGSYYDFYIVIEDSGKTFTSSPKSNIVMQPTGTATVSFGNMTSQTQNASNWAGSSPVPEPTSGLLMLLGMAGLALRRKRA